MAYQTPGAPPAAGSSPNYAGQGTPETAEELQSLVAPIALYPDALVAQILNAATFPDQVAVADNWMQQNKNLTGSALGTAVNGQTWDPSVKALTQFPSVLHNMAQNLAWTSQLGEAYHNQQSEVMAAIQTLRAQAKAAGNLKSGSQITVVQQSPQTIVIQPTNPQVVYVPAVQPGGDLRHAVRGSELHHDRCGRHRPACVWRWDGRRGDDERRLLRLGLQQLELQLVRWRGVLPRRSLLRERCLARRLLRHQCLRLWSLRQRARRLWL